MSPTTATFAPQKVPTCICALCIQETEYVSHHSPFALRNVHTCICALCIQETEYISAIIALLHCWKYLHVFVHYVFRKQNMSDTIAPFCFAKCLHVFVHYVIRKQNMSATTVPSALQKVPTCLWALGISHNRPLCTAKSTHLYNFTDQDSRSCYP